MRVLEQNQSAISVEAVLSALRQYLDRPGALFDPSEALVRISHLAAVARDAGYEKALEYRAVLTQMEKARHSLSNDAFQHVAVAVIGDPTQAKVARQVANVMKAQRHASGHRILGGVVLMVPVRPPLVLLLRRS